MSHCARCKTRVFYAEQMLAFGQHWHVQCLSCSADDCGKRLDSRTCSEHDGLVGDFAIEMKGMLQPYCTYCYKRLFGPKGYGYGIGAGTLSVPDVINNNNSNMIVKQHGNPAVSLISYGQETPKQRFIDSVDERFMEKKKQPNAENGNGILKARPCAAVPSEKQICRRCNAIVYEAEKMLAAGSVWHKNCFMCAECNRRLESRTLAERAGQLYCTGCYARNFGPRGYGHGIGGSGVVQPLN